MNNTTKIGGSIAVGGVMTLLTMAVIEPTETISSSKRICIDACGTVETDDDVNVYEVTTSKGRKINLRVPVSEPQQDAKLQEEFNEIKAAAKSQ